MSKKAKDLTDEEIKVLQDKKRNERVARVAKGLEKLLKEEACVLQMSMIVNEKGNFPQLVVVAK